jgi:hypothetical protein
MAAADPVVNSNEFLQEATPAVWEALSPLGRLARQPANFLPLQTAEAKGKPFNATIGQITDGHGRAVPLPSMAAALPDLDEEERSRAFLYSSVEGLPDLRRAWREWQRRGQRDDLPSSLPLVTIGTAQARCLAADLFAMEGRAVVLPDPCREGDHDLFAMRLGTRVLKADPSLLAGLPEGEPAVMVSGDLTEATSLLEIAEHRPLVVIVDDTREDSSAPGNSLFWSLTGRHPNLIPLKVDGADGQVGFLTFPWNPESGIAAALESKAKMLLRAQVGSPSATSQVRLLRLLRERLP